MKPLLVFTLPNHWAIKNLLHSGVLAKLQPTFRLAAYAAEERLPFLQSLAGELGLEPIEWRVSPLWHETKFQQFNRQFQKGLLYEIHDIQTEKIIQKSARGRRGRGKRIGSTFIAALAKLPIRGLLYRWASRQKWNLTPSNLYDLQDRPALVFTLNPFDFREDPLVKQAVAANIPVVTLIPSWDNLTNKGVLCEGFREIYVWNTPNEEDFRRLYPERSDVQVRVTGNPRTQVFEENLPIEYSKEHLWPRLGLDLTQKTLLFANTSTVSFPRQKEVARHLSAEMRPGGLLADCQLLVRNHPHDDPEYYMDLLDSPSVRVWPHPGQQEATFGFNTAPPASDMWMLSAMLKHSDVVVNSASTIVLDAAVAGTPMVSICYDGDAELSYHDSIRSAYDYEHQQPYLNSGAGVLCPSKSSLIEAIQAALSEPSIRLEQRRTLAQFATPGRSADLLAEALIRAAKEPA